MSKIVAVDIGHGEDTWEKKRSKGVIRDGIAYEEHHFNARVGLKLIERLKQHDIAIVIGQHPFHPEVPLKARTSKYNTIGVDLVWSIHADANNDPNRDGRWAFYWETSANGKRLAEIYAAEMVEAGYSLVGDGTRASVKGTWSDFHICRETKAVAVLTENGFMTNENDFQLLFNNKQYITNVAEIHLKSILTYFGISYIPLSTELTYPSDLSDWARSGYDFCMNNGITDGVRPKESLTREESWVMLERLYKTIKKE